MTRHRTTWHRSLALCLPLVVVSGLTACRSDGGVGRADSQHSLAWCTEVLSDQHGRDVKQTAANASQFVEWVVQEVTDPLSGMRRSVRLYTEGSAGNGD